MKQLLRTALNEVLRSLEKKYDTDLSDTNIEVKENKEKDINLALFINNLRSD